MTERQPGNPRGSGRKDLGHTGVMMLKLHPDLKSYIEQAAKDNYCSAAEYIRRLIVTDKKEHANEWGGRGKEPDQ